MFFKPKILTRLLLRRFFFSVGIILLVLCGIIFAITFVERLPINDTAGMALYDAWARLFGYIPLFLPMAVFMGTLFSSYNLTKSSESIIISTSGMGPFQIARPFLIGAAIIGLISTTVINPYAVNLSSKNITAENLSLVDDVIWLRESSKNGFLTVRAKDVSVYNNDLVFKDAIIFVQTPDFKLKERIETNKITLSQNGLDTQKAKIWDDKGTNTISSWNYNTLLNPKTVLDRYLQPNQISFWRLPEFIEKMKDIGAPVRGHIIQLWTLLFMPLTLIALTLLAVAFSQTRQRRNFNFMTKFGIGIIVSFILYFLLNLFSALGLTGALPALLAITAPPIIIIAAAGAFIASFDTI